MGFSSWLSDKESESESDSVLSDSATHQVSLSMGFPRPEYWSGLPIPSPGYLPDPGIKPGSPALQEMQELACNARDARDDPWVEKISWSRDRLPAPVLFWEIPWTEDPGGLQSTGS